MSRDLSVDYATVLAAAESLAVVATRLTSAPAEDGLRRIDTAIPSSTLGAAARTKAAEWQREMAQVTAAVEAFTDSLRNAVDTYRTTDERLVR